MADPEPSASAPPPSEFSDAPPEEERSASSYLILAVNVVLLALALWWVIHRAQQGTGAVQPGAEAAPAGGAGTGTGTQTPPITPIAPPNWTQGVDDDPFGSRAGGTRKTEGDVPGRVTASGRRVLQPRPQMDAATLAQCAGLESGIAALGPSLEVFRTIRSAYPSSKKDYGANRGIEAVVEVLEERGALEGSGLSLGDTDADGRKEILDPWGRALVYFSNDDYGSTQELTGVGNVDARERWVDDQKLWQGEERFQLFSVGPNGRDDWGGYDDVNSWVTAQ